MIFSKKLIFFDLNRTIRYSPSGIIPRLNAQKIYPQARVLLRAAKEQGIKQVAILNYPEVERGIIPVETVFQELAQLNFEKLLDWIIFCPQYSGSGQNCYYSDAECKRWISLSENYYRKPNSGMLRVASALTEISLAESVLIGEKGDNQTTAQNAKVDFLDAAKWRKIKILG